MPDRYGDEPVVDLDAPAADFDSHRRARETAESIERARQQRERLADTRTTHGSLTAQQAEALRAHRNTVTTQAEARRNKLRIANCQLCDPDGYRGPTVCDHIDHTPAAARGMAAVREAMGWPDPEEKP